MKKSKNQKIKIGIISLICAALIIWSVVDIPFTGIKEQAGKITLSILDGLIHPDWSYVWTGDGEDLISNLVATIAMAFLGVFLSSIISVPFAFFASRTRYKHRLNSTIGKFVLTFIRTFPEIVLALMFIKAVGPGAFAGVMAMAIHSIGMLAKLFSEAIENLDNGTNEAVIATGGSRTNMVMFSTLPQVMPEFVSSTLYRFELSIRSATTLGLVGAGGIGTPLIFALSTRSWSRVGIILIGIIVMVTFVDFISSFIRKKLV
ncbi:phosphonate ABC transporter, permease protein PhnE [Holzapfeliella sp. JNUCC 80]